MLRTTGIEALQAPACFRLKKCTPFRSGKARSLTTRAVTKQSVDDPVSRRQALQSLVLLAAVGVTPQQALAAGKSAEVGRSVFSKPHKNRSDQGLSRSFCPFSGHQELALGALLPSRYT